VRHETAVLIKQEVNAGHPRAAEAVNEFKGKVIGQAGFWADARHGRSAAWSGVAERICAKVAGAGLTETVWRGAGYEVRKRPAGMIRRAARFSHPRGDGDG